ncbi:TetR/AcrR family transcriptional regulator [Alkalihalobacillus macyae]|uniref:TetR/AcrR family transcriptional regulator n=1 Tax=Guptibacillus hwajinpoensis TaxID=208199 RepID=UPI00273BB239|nr:TetR/AcrR family transcriptional regulator [Alkalihalobacillus macyae]MDP4549281.1 TetR/AcrR family transcriptional regulator [Alkalihalobacillus macyae]
MTNRKEEIISATAGLIHGKGFESTRLSDILSEANIGKGQFYHYFSSKRDLGIAVVDHFVETWQRDLIQNILQTDDSARSKLDKMLSWAIQYHESQANMHGCPFGNLALEMSEHDEVFREKVNKLLHDWIESLEKVVKNLVDDEPLKHAQSIVAQLEGGILLMKNYQDISILKNIADTIRMHYLQK